MSAIAIGPADKLTWKFFKAIKFIPTEHSPTTFVQRDENFGGLRVNHYTPFRIHYKDN